MRGINKPDLYSQASNPLPSKISRPQLPRKHYLNIKRQREIDAMVEFTRNQLMDRYDG